MNKHILIKIQAFSMMELMIAMLLSSIFFSLGYLCYDMSLKQFTSFRNKNAVTSDGVSFYSALQSDFERSDKVKKKNHGEWVIYTAKKEMISYTYHEDYLTRKINNVSDTFFIQSNNLKMLFNNLDVIEGALIDKLAINVKAGESIQAILFTKEYSAEEIINEDLLAEHGN